MFKKILVAAVSSMITLSVFAVDTIWVEKSIELEDGSTVHIFTDGKMGMESKFGHVADMKPGQVMQTKDGETIVMKGNELARVDHILRNKNTNSP